MKKASGAVLLGTILALAAGAQQSTYREQMAPLRRDFGIATKAKDYAGMERLLLQMNELLHGRTDMAYNLACTYALKGDKENAIRWFGRYVAMGAATDAAKDPDLASLLEYPRFKAALVRMEQNRQPVTHSTTAATIGDAGLLTEDIAYEPHTHSFLVTSVLNKKIVRIDPNGQTTDFADLSRDPGWPLFAIHADAKHKNLWVSASALQGFVASPTDIGKTALLKLDLGTGRILQRIAPPDTEKRSLGDMDVAPNGDVIVTDSMEASIYRLPFGGTAFQRLDHGEFGSPQTPAVTPDGKSAYVADYARGIARIDLRSGDVIWLKHGDEVALTATDGLVLHGNHLYGMQNGASPVRIVKLTLSSAGDAVEKLEVVEANYPELGDPTHAVAVGDELYFIANSGWSALDDKGNVKAGEKMTPATIRKLPFK